MNDVSALIVIDTDGALASGSATDNAYLVDTNGFLGSWQEGSNSLHTVCQDGQTVKWSVSPVSPSGNVTITGFSGDMVSQDVCAPVAEGPVGDQFWWGRIEAQGQFASFAYTLTLSIDGSAMSLSSFLKVA
jgi:hypothetical protein